MMSDKFQNKYRIPSARLQNWNYGSNAMYFITICTQNHVNYFGNIVNGEMKLSQLGKLAESEWVKTSSIRPDMNLGLDAFVVLPNHFHAILVIGLNEYNRQPDTAVTKTLEFKNKFGSQSKNLASIARGFKSSVTTYARKNGINFQWQARFHDHIIKNNESYNRIRNYIITNPQNWGADKFKN